MAQSAQAIPAQAAIFAPDVYARQTQLARQQKLAEMLQTQGLEIPQGQMVSGHYVAPAASQHLARLASVLGGTYLNSRNDEKQAELAKQYGQAMQGQVDNMLGGNSAQGDVGLEVAKFGDQTGNSGPPDPALVSQLQTAAQEPPEILRLKNAAKAALMMGNQDLANKLIGNVLEMTTEQKNMRAMGQDPRLMGQLGMAKATKEGTQTLLPGQTNIIPGIGTVVAPNYETGVAGGVDAQGRPFASEIPGSAAIAANRAGGIKRAESGVVDAFAVPSPVDAKGGKVAMTPAQQRAAANGGTDPAFPRVSAQQQAGRDADRKEIIRQELLANPNDPALRKEATQIGIPLESETDKARASTLMAIQSDSLKALTKDADSMRGMVPVFDQIESLIKQGTKGNSAIDRLEMLGHSTGLRQTDATTNTANLAKLGEQLVLARGSLGAGVSVADAERYDKAAGNFTKAQSNAEKLKYLGVMREVIKESYDRANTAIKNFGEGKQNVYGESEKSSPTGGGFKILSVK